jgi:ER-bound oxygenase mpaB/B'/Rubber oxygenase, catalytic domain
VSLTVAASRLIEQLDPDRDYLSIFRLSFDGAFDWEVHRGLELALFHTFAAPSISEILDRTGEFAQRGQKRYDDTIALLREVARDGLVSPRGRAAIRRMNWIHRAYDIRNDDLVYVLATFVVIPIRWIGRYGWRNLTDKEIRAAVNYYREMGRLMGIRQIPPTYAGFASFLDAYEREHHSFSEANRRLALSLIETFQAWYPRPVRPLTRLCIVATLGESLRPALGLREPSGLVRAGVHIVLRTRAALVRLVPLLRPERKGPRGLRSYPDGYGLSDLGPAWSVGQDPGRRHSPPPP